MKQTDFFEKQNARALGDAPLAALLRPQKLSEMIGCEKLLAPSSPLGAMIKAKSLGSLIFWGPPGSGKTSIALATIQYFKASHVQLNAVDVSIKELKEVIESGRIARLSHGQKTVVFCDEIHRLNRGQQDVLLPALENGDIILLGATTENPSYELTSAILSRTRVIVLEPLSKSAMQQLFFRALEYLKISTESWGEDIQNVIIASAQGDARKLISNVELCYQAHLQESLNLARASEVLSSPSGFAGSSSDYIYDHLSALIKSIRGSDADAALFYMVSLLEGGVDPIQIGRRLVVLASEDIGNADPRALQMAVAAVQAIEIVGMPEARINLSHVVTYLSSAPKSNRSYLALKKAESFIKNNPRLSVPLSLRSSQTAMSQQMGYGKGYQYPHDEPKGWIAQSYWPAGAEPQSFYEPSQNGFEKTIIDLKKWREGGA